MKLLTDKRGPLQGADAAQIVRHAYGPEASLETDPEGEHLGVILRRGTVIDTLIAIDQE